MVAGHRHSPVRACRFEPHSPVPGKHLLECTTPTRENCPIQGDRPRMSQPAPRPGKTDKKFLLLFSKRRACSFLKKRTKKLLSV
jgi:hypothetical protein